MSAATTGAKPAQAGKPAKPDEPKTPETQVPGSGAPSHKSAKMKKAEKKRLKALAALNLKKKMLRDHLKREIAMVEKNVKRGEEKWEALCGEIKLQEFNKEIRQWGIKVQELMEVKDVKINKLMQNIDETSEMRERNFSRHLDQLEYLTNCQNALRTSAQSLFELQAADIIQDFINENSVTRERQESINIYTENMMHTSNVVAKALLKENYANYMERKFDDVCSHVEIRYLLRDRTVDFMRNLQDQLLLWIKQLQGDMVDVHKTEKFLHFMKRQQNYVKESTKLNDIEKQSQKLLSDLEEEFLELELNSSRQLNSLKLEHEYFLKVRSVIKGSIMRNKQMTHEKLLSHASESYRVINKLKEIVKFGELLINLTMCCSKYKTEREKFLPLSPDDKDPSDDDDYIFRMSLDLVELLDISADALGEQMSLMKYFWKRCSRVRFQNQILKYDKKKLNEENDEYRNILMSLKKSDDVAYIMESLNIEQLLTYIAC